MSHVDVMEVDCSDLDVVEAAIKRLHPGAELRRNQKTYAWWGHSIGDYPIPDGFTEKDLGKCDHAIRIPGCAYEIGIVKHPKTGQYVFIADFFQTGSLKRICGAHGNLLKQAYTVEKTTKAAKAKGFKVKETKRSKLRRFLSRDKQSLGIQLKITR